MTTCFDYSFDKEYKFSTLVDLLGYRVENQSEQTAFIFLPRGEMEEVRLTYGQLDRQAKAIAYRLQSLGYSGQQALLLYPSGLEFIAAFFGCLYAGVVAVPAYPPTKRAQTLSRLEVIAVDSSSVIALTSRQAFTSFSERWKNNAKLSSLDLLITDDIEEDLAVNWQQPDITSSDLAFLQYTSGSTGTPKGVMVSHGNLLHNLATIHKSFEHTPNSRGVIWLPLYHDMGLIGGVLQPIYGSFSVTLMPSVTFLQKPIRWLQAISRYRATTSGGPDFAYDLVCRKIKPEQLASLDLSSWEVAFTGAETIRAETLERFANCFQSCGFHKQAFYPCYGMAETTLMASGSVKSTEPYILKVQGSALENNQVVIAQSGEISRAIVGCGQNLSRSQRIVIANPENCTLCPDQSIGEIWVSGLSIAQGYWNKPQETEQTFQAYLADTKEGPFLRTGDLGFLQDGQLYVTGRVKDIIIIRGQNHYPHDIEMTVQNSHPALLPNSGAAFAVEIKNVERLIIVQELARSYVRKLDINEIVLSIKQAVTREHELQVYSVILLKPGGLPKTSSGKIMRHACKRDFLNGSLNVVDEWSENPQGKVKFLNLQAEVDSMLKRLQQ